MKRKFDEISQEESNKENDTSALFGPESKRRKLDSQKIGDFIVDAKQAFNFRLSSNIKGEDNIADFFGPTFMHLMFGETERISGYEGLSVDITLSAKRFIPYVNIGYEQKAPSFANVDNLQDKLKKHFGKIYEDQSDFSAVLKEEEESFIPKGDKLTELTIHDREYEVFLVSLEDESFHEQSYYLQALLPFFIDGASVIEPCPFWKYFMVYEKSKGHLVAFATVFEAHQTAVKFRARISQVIVLPPYQKRGLGVKLYETVSEFYQQRSSNCFEIIIEDSADDFQRIQDFVNSKAYLAANTQLKDAIINQPRSKLINRASEIPKLALTKEQAQKYSKDLKLPESIIYRCHELVLYSFIDDSPDVQTAFKSMVEKRLYKICVKAYFPLFKCLETQEKKEGLSQPYVFNASIKDDPFGLKLDNQEEVKESETKKEGEISADAMLTQEAAKIQMQQMLQEIDEEFSLLKKKISELIK